MMSFIEGFCRLNEKATIERFLKLLLSYQSPRMSPSISYNQMGEIVKTSGLSSNFYAFLKGAGAQFIQEIISEFKSDLEANSKGVFQVFGHDISYRITFSDNLYTIFFFVEEELMHEGPEDNEKYKLIVEAANEIIYEADARGKFIYVNPKTLAITGFEREEILGKSYLDLIHPNHSEQAKEFYKNQVLELKKSTYQEIPIITKSGEQIWIGLNVQLLENDFTITGFLGVGRDITESYHNRLALRQSEEKYRGIIQNLQYGLMEVDLDEKIVYANDAMTQITGYTQKELIGQVASELLVETDGLEVLSNEHKKRDDGSPSVYEIRLKHKEGGHRWTMISGAPIYNVDGSRRGSIGIHMDITDRIEAEEELRLTRSRLKKYKDGIEALNWVTSNLRLSSVDQIVEGLKIAKEYLGMNLAVISQIDGDRYTVKHFVSGDKTDLKEGDEFKLSDTFCELVIGQDNILYITDVSKSEYTDHPCHSLFGVESYLGINYTVDGDRRGTVNFSAPIAREEKFDTYDLEFINLFSKWIGYTITLYENHKRQLDDQAVLAEKNKELERNQLHLSAINDFVTSLLEDESISEIAWEIAENVIHKFGYNDCVIFVMNEELGMLEQIAAYGSKKSKDRSVVDSVKVPLGRGIVGSVAQSGKAEIVSDTSKDRRYLIDDAVRYSEITVPIIADGKVIGVIDSEHKEKNYFNESHLYTLTTIAHIAANRLKNAFAKREQERAEKELKDSEEKLRKILHNAIDAVITIDDKGIVREWNLQAELIFGFTPEEAIGRTLTETIIPPQHHKSHDKGMERFRETGHGPVLNQKIEITALRKSGEEFPVEMAIIPVESKGKHIFTAFLSDITIQKQVQSEMEKALGKERELNELKSRFVSMTSHEFRTPLTTIKQNTDLISYQLESMVPNEYPIFKKYIDRIDSDVNRLTSLMNDILMLGRIEAGRVQMKKSMIDFVNFVEKLVQKHSEADMHKRQIQLTVQGVPQQVEIDVQLMDHVVSNLLSNALKYSPGAKAPEVNLSFSSLSKLSLQVKDYGIGIPEKDIRSLFESFFRATNVRNIQGSGLGLSIVKEFTEMHNGNISVKSAEGKGSEFTIELPLS